MKAIMTACNTRYCHACSIELDIIQDGISFNCCCAHSSGLHASPETLPLQAHKQQSTPPPHTAMDVHRNSCGSNCFGTRHLFSDSVFDDKKWNAYASWRRHLPEPLLWPEIIIALSPMLIWVFVISTLISVYSTLSLIHGWQAITLSSTKWVPLDASWACPHHGHHDPTASFHHYPLSSPPCPQVPPILCTHGHPFGVAVGL
jgi:hypothetical protein